MLLEVTFGKLYAWAIQNVRNILLDANAKFKELGESHCCIFLEFPKVRILKSVPFVCAENYFDFLSVRVLFHVPAALTPP